MDPKATFDEMMRASLSKDSDRVQECAQSLLQWLDNGGFVPEFDAFSALSTTDRERLIRRTCKAHLLLVRVWRKLADELKP